MDREILLTHAGTIEILLEYMNKDKKLLAPGWPGIPAQWISSAKSGVGTALNNISNVWFTISHGILTEIYYPRVDQACTRDMGLIITDGSEFFSEEKWDTNHQIEFMFEGIPAYRVVNFCDHYRIEKEIITDPSRDSVLQRVHFIPNKNRGFLLYALLAPHLANLGSGNNAWVGDYKGVPMLFAERAGIALAFACSVPWKKRSVGYVGSSDGWQDLQRHKKLCWQFERAEKGNVALTGEVDLAACDNIFTLAIGFGQSWAEAAQKALASILDDFDIAKQKYIDEWRDWQKTLLSLKTVKKSSRDLFLISASVLRVHESKKHPGGLVASLSIPWGFSKGDDDFGGYHLVWPRDLVQTAGGLLALKAGDDAKKTINHLMITQEADGHWPQNMWLDGTPYWTGIQMDQTAFPILLIDLASREGTLETQDLQRFWPMVKKAAAYIIRNGPVTEQCRWEENSGYSPYTLAVEIAALLIAADMADINNEPELAIYLRETADNWNDNIERWTYVKGTDLAKRIGVEGYYVRIASSRTKRLTGSKDIIKIINRAPGENIGLAEEVISPDALALVRYGLRAADDIRILNTIKVIDDLLKVETPYGPCWYRYNGDGYGEHKDGRPFDGTGVGRTWPLLTGERAHYEIAAGKFEVAKKLLKTLEEFANEGGMIPEQIWDQEDIPERELFFGRPTGAAMPLVWAHAEYIKLCRSLKGKRVFDMPPQTRLRYVEKKTSSNYTIFRFSDKCRSICRGKILRIETLAPAIICCSLDNWNTVQDMPAKDMGIGIYVVDIPTRKLNSGRTIEFTFYWPEADKWEGENFIVEVSKKEELIMA